MPPFGRIGKLNVMWWLLSYLMFAENGDQVGISYGLQGVWKRLVARGSLDEGEEEETTYQASTKSTTASTAAKFTEHWQRTQHIHSFETPASHTYLPQ